MPLPGNFILSAEIQRESLLNGPALMFMSVVLLIAFWVLFPRQPAFRDPSNLSAKDALSVAYLRVLVQSDPNNAPLRLSLVQVLTEAGLTEEAVQAIEPLKRAPQPGLAYEVGMAELKLSLQQLYRHPPQDAETVLRARIAELIPSLLHIAATDRELTQVVTLAEQFAEPSVLAETFEQLLVIRNETDERKSNWLVFAAKQRIAAAQPRLAARDLFKAFLLERSPKSKREMAKSGLRAYLQAGVDGEALKAAVRALDALDTENDDGKSGADAELLLLAASIAEPLADNEHALAWLKEAGALLPNDRALAERIVRLQVSMGLLDESLPYVERLLPVAAPGSKRQKLLAHIYDWTAHPDQALSLWLSFARVRGDSEAESRAFALARAKPDHRAMLQLLEAVMERRRLTHAEAEAYITAGLAVTQPAHVEQQLRRHAARFNNPPETLKALTEVLVLQGKPHAALAIPQGEPGTMSGRERLALAKLYEEAGEAQKSFELLSREPGPPDPADAEAYWLLLARVATQLGKDPHAEKAYEKLLELRPNDVNALENLQRLAVRHRDDKKSERLARYGWDRLKRIEDLQRLMLFSWKRKNWQELQQWLAAADELAATNPRLLEQASDYWYFRAISKITSGDRDAARDALRHILKLRGADPEITEAMIWLLLSDKKIDSVLLDAVVKPYRSQAGGQAPVSPPLMEALAAAEHVLGKPVQAAAWYLRTLETRPRDFLWTLVLADNMEWAGCPVNANHVRYSALKMLASHPSKASQASQGAEVRHYERLAEYFSGLRDSGEQAAGTDESKKRQSLVQRWGFAKAIDNARFFALNRLSERLSLPSWLEFADAIRAGDAKIIGAKLTAVSDYLHREAAAPVPEGLLPLSVEDVQRAGQWLAGEAAPMQGSLNKEPEVCRQTLSKINSLQQSPMPDKKPAAPDKKQESL
jgi:predicted Zn-dependent protease